MDEWVLNGGRSDARTVISSPLSEQANLKPVAGLELKRQLTQELREVLIEYHQLELEIDCAGAMPAWHQPWESRCVCGVV
jgi:hypothetical protein